ncbi:MAG: hypothetical protein ACRCXN_12930 [Bacteroidales bacterium]
MARAGAGVSIGGSSRGYKKGGVMEWVAIGCIGFFLLASLIISMVLTNNNQQKFMRIQAEDRRAMEKNQTEMQIAQINTNARLETAINHLAVSVDGNTNAIVKLTSQTERTAVEYLKFSKETIAAFDRAYYNDMQNAQAIMELQNVVNALIFSNSNTNVIVFTPTKPNIYRLTKLIELNPQDAPSSDSTL